MLAESVSVRSVCSPRRIYAPLCGGSGVPSAPICPIQDGIFSAGVNAAVYGRIIVMTQLPSRLLRELINRKLQLLVLCAGRVLQCVARWRLVEENYVSMVARGLRKWVGPQNSLHFGSCAHNDTNWLSGTVAQAPFEIGFHSCWRRFAFKNDITTGNVGLDARKPGVAAQNLQFSHWELARSANVHCAHECNIFGHVSSISWGGRSSPQARCVMPPTTARRLASIQTHLRGGGCRSA
jgi:hypothetical protein